MVPPDILGNCNAHLYIGDDNNILAIVCGLPENHSGQHQSIFESRLVTINWLYDQRKRFKDFIAITPTIPEEISKTHCWQRVDFYNDRGIYEYDCRWCDLTVLGYIGGPKHSFNHDECPKLNNVFAHDVSDE